MVDRVGPGSFFTGLIDDVRIYNKVLSAREIKIAAGLLNASNPSPADGATDIPKENPVLTWSPGAFAAASGGSIVYYSENENDVIIAVKDSGCGIDGHDLKDMFNPFVTTKKEGMGMGLAISKTIIEAHGGRIWAENNPDRGAIFYVVLPTNKKETT